MFKQQTKGPPAGSSETNSTYSKEVEKKPNLIGVLDHDFSGIPVYLLVSSCAIILSVHEFSSSKNVFKQKEAHFMVAF